MRAVIVSTSAGHPGPRADDRLRHHVSDPMRLTVLGKSPSWQDAGGACSGYLLEDGDTSVLIDCGNGVFSKLRRFRDYTKVDAVVISHLHADHFLDLVPYSYALTYAPRQQPVPVDRWPGTDNPARPELHGPPGARETFRKIVGCWGNNDLIENAFELAEYDGSSQLSIGPVRIAFQEVPHYTETFAMRISSENGSGEIVYGADSSATELGVPDALLSLVARNPRAAERKQVAQLLGLWDTRLLCAIAGGGVRRFTSLAQAERERVLLSWADSRVTQRRAAFQALRKGTLLAYYGQGGENGSRNPVWDAIGYPGPLGPPR